MRACKARHATLAAVAAVALLALGGCRATDPGALFAGMVEGLARGACDQADNCRNVCPDGAEARAPTYRCPGPE